MSSSFVNFSRDSFPLNGISCFYRNQRFWVFPKSCLFTGLRCLWFLFNVPAQCKNKICHKSFQFSVNCWVAWSLTLRQFAVQSNKKLDVKRKPRQPKYQDDYQKDLQKSHSNLVCFLMAKKNVKTQMFDFCCLLPDCASVSCHMRVFSCPWRCEFKHSMAANVTECIKNRKSRKWKSVLCGPIILEAEKQSWRNVMLRNGIVAQSLFVDICMQTCV